MTRLDALAGAGAILRAPVNANPSPRNVTNVNGPQDDVLEGAGAIFQAPVNTNQAPGNFTGEKGLQDVKGKWKGEGKERHLRTMVEADFSDDGSSDNNKLQNSSTSSKKNIHNDGSV